MTATPHWDTLQLVEGNPGVMVRRPLVILCGGDITSAAVLSQIVFWQPHAVITKATKAGPNGRREPVAPGLPWIAKSTNEWFEEIGIGKRALENAIKHLKTLGLIEAVNFRFNGSPTRHVRIIPQAIDAALADLVNIGFSPVGKMEVPQAGRTDLPHQGDSEFPQGGSSVTESTQEITEQENTAEISLSSQPEATGPPGHAGPDEREIIPADPEVDEPPATAPAARSGGNAATRAASSESVAESRSGQPKLETLHQPSDSYSTAPPVLDTDRLCNLLADKIHENVKAARFEPTDGAKWRGPMSQLIRSYGSEEVERVILGVFEHDDFWGYGRLASPWVLQKSWETIVTSLARHTGPSDFDRRLEKTMANFRAARGTDQDEEPAEPSEPQPRPEPVPEPTIPERQLAQVVGMLRRPEDIQLVEDAQPGVADRHVDVLWEITRHGENPSSLIAAIRSEQAIPDERTA